MIGFSLFGWKRAPRQPYLQKSPSILDFGQNLAGILTKSAPFFRVLLVGAALMHLTIAMVFPGGDFIFTDTQAPKPMGYLDLAEVGDVTGFYQPFGIDGFFFYKIYPATGDPIEDSFPDVSIQPRIRYDRWASYIHQAAQNHPEMQLLFLNYLTENLPSPPLRVELHSARWLVPGTSSYLEPNGAKAVPWRELRKLGEYDGLRRHWANAQEEKKKAKKKGKK